MFNYLLIETHSNPKNMDRTARAEITSIRFFSEWEKARTYFNKAVDNAPYDNGIGLFRVEHGNKEIVPLSGYLWNVATDIDLNYE